MRANSRFRIRMFFRFYLFCMFAAFVIYSVTDIIRMRVMDGFVARAQYQVMRETVTQLEQRIITHPNRDWPATIKELNENFIYPLEVEGVDVARKRVDDEQYQQLMLGDFILTTDGFVLKKMQNTHNVLVVGPINPDVGEDLQKVASIETRILFYEWVWMALLVGLFAYIWLRPVWRDVFKVRKAATSLSAGNLNARVKGRTTDIFRPIALALNNMADNIQEFVLLRREMTNTMAHELRTPIARVRFHLNDYFDAQDEKQKLSAINHIYLEIDEVETLISTALNYASVENHKAMVVPKKQYMSSWLDGQIESARLGTANIDFIKRYSSDLGWVEMDLKLMPYVLRNLLGNAKKHAKSIILVSAGREGDTLKFTVEDDGAGIDPSDYEKVFKPFFRGEKDETQGLGGFGLGLAIVERIVTLHQGSARVTASSLGGACFIIELPCRHQ